VTVFEKEMKLLGYWLLPDKSVILRPRILKNSYAESVIGPRVSMAIGRNRYAVDSLEYF